MSQEPIRDPAAAGIPRVTRAWYVVARSDELGAKPIERTVNDTPLVLFRTERGEVGALLDRCPHRNVPLSLGRVRGDTLECGYHGWRFTPEGSCTHVPALCAQRSGEGQAQGGRAATSFPCREQDGYVWVWADEAEAPVGDPFHFPLLDAPGYTTVHEHVVADATLHATAENALDVPHTAFLHAGLFRSDETERNRVEVVVRRWADRVEAEYIGEPRPEGVIGRFLAPKGGVVEHFDRFLLPSIAQVEYRLGDNHVLVCAALTPESDFRTHLHAVVSFKLPVPGFLIAPALKPLAMRIFGQDAVVLARQSENIRRFGGERFVSTEIDVLGPHITRLLRAAERGAIKDPDKDPTVRRLAMNV